MKRPKEKLFEATGKLFFYDEQWKVLILQKRIWKCISFYLASVQEIERGTLFYLFLTEFKFSTFVCQIVLNCCTFIALHGLLLL